MILDNFHAGYLACQKLIENGHKEIGFIGNIYATSSIADRFLGCCRAMIDNNLVWKKDYLISDRNDDGILIELTLPEKMPTAIVCNNDFVAYKYINFLESKGYKVPEDISIISFDNTLFSTISNPQITTIDNNVEEAVDLVCKVILKKLTANNKRYGRILVEGKIINRNSIKAI